MFSPQNFVLTTAQNSTRPQKLKHAPQRRHHSIAVANKGPTLYQYHAYSGILMNRRPLPQCLDRRPVLVAESATGKWIEPALYVCISRLPFTRAAAVSAKQELFLEGAEANKRAAVRHIARSAGSRSGAARGD